MYPYDHLIAVTDRSLCSGDFLAQIKKIISLHPCSLILRERDLPDEEKIGCQNLHLPLPALAAIGGRPEGFACVSTSSHSMEDMQQALALGADLIILGTIFETECKKGLRGRGLSFVEEICAACPVPVYAIGGIKESNIDAVMAAGAAGGCMMSRFMEI